MTSVISMEDPEKQKFSNTDLGDPNILAQRPFNHRRTTIIVSFANPNIAAVDIETIMETGMNVARFLPFQSTSGDKVELITKVVTATNYLAEKHGIVEWPCATCIELKTCILKTGILEEDHFVILEEGSEVTLTNDPKKYDKCNQKEIFVDNPFMTTEMKVGMEISLRQETIIMKVKEIKTSTVVCTVTKTGKLKNFATMCMRGAKRQHPYLSKKDLELVKLALDNGVDMIMIQYTRHVETLKRLKKLMKLGKKRPFLVCGICTYEGLQNIDDIVKEADAMVVAREYLTYELDKSMMGRMERIQRYIIGKCRQAGKPVYMSGQILRSVYKTDQLSARDACDITNSLLLGVSGFILEPFSKPDAIRRAIKELTDLCMEIEPFTNDKIDFRRRIQESGVPLNAAMGAVTSCALMANETQAKMIVIPTVSGRTVYYLNTLRTVCTIIAVTSNIKTFRLLQINRSVVPLLYHGSARSTWEKTVKDRINFAIEHALNNSWLAYSDYYITLQKGAELSAYCDTVRIFEVLTRKKTLISCKDEYKDKNDTVSIKTRTSL